MSDVKESTVHTTTAWTVGEMAAFLASLDPDAVLIEAVPESVVQADGRIFVARIMRVVTRP